MTSTIKLLKGKIQHKHQGKHRLFASHYRYVFFCCFHPVVANFCKFSSIPVVIDCVMMEKIQLHQLVHFFIGIQNYILAKEFYQKENFMA